MRLCAKIMYYKVHNRFGLGLTTFRLVPVVVTAELLWRAAIRDLVQMSQVTRG